MLTFSIALFFLFSSCTRIADEEKVPREKEYRQKDFQDRGQRR
jgi:hypothetical protein